MRRRRSDDRGPGVPGHQDKNQQFVAAMCARYLWRVPSQYPLLSQEAMTLLHWILGPATDAFALRMMELARALDRSFFEEEVIPCSTDPEEYPNALAEGFKKIPKSRRSSLLRFTLRLLRHAESVLKCRGKSDVEKNVDAVKKMFRLTDHEARYCLFRFITAAWTQPRQYFESHLRCNIYSGRPYVMTALDMNRSELDQVLTGTLQRIGMLESDGFDQEVTIASNYLQPLQDPASGFVSKNFFTPVKVRSIPLESHMLDRERTGHILTLLRKKPGASTHILLYGPPGKGKSELARYIAGTLNRELICKRSSDLLNPYVGMTEKNLASAFDEAETQEAVLVMDEVDSILASRDRAHHTWEVSFTNELLAQMERFRGILICTTNRLMDLDQASIRRFNFKIGFNYLKPEGNVLFYARLLGPLISEPLTDGSKMRLAQISPLAPGDFRSVRDRFALCAPDTVTHDGILRALEEEAKIKKFHSRQKEIGF